MLPHYLVKNNSSEAACRIVDHTHTHTHTHTQHINPALSEPPTYYWGRPFI